MKAMSLIIGACIIIILMAAVLTGLVSFRSASRTDLYNITTGVGVTSGSANLTQSLFDDSTASVSITSNNTGDAPVPASYNSATKTLTINGLLESITRQLSITYSYSQLSSYFGADIASKTLPVMIILGVLGVIVGAVIVATRHNE